MAPSGLVMRLRHRLRQLLARRSMRYLMAAAVNTLAGFTVFPALLFVSRHFREHYLVALAIAQVVCLCFAFSTYKLGVFRTRGNLFTEFVRFSSFYLANYVLNWLILPLLVEFGSVDPVVAQSGFVLVIMVTSYFWHGRVTFRESLPKSG